MNKRFLLAAVGSGVALTAVVGVALGVGQDEARLVRTVGVSTPVEVSTSTTAAQPTGEEPAVRIAELDATVENHEGRIRALESTTTTGVAAPAVEPVPTTSTTAPVEAVEPSTTTTTVPVSTTRPAPTTTTTSSCWQLDGAGHRSWVPCDSTTTTTAG